MKTKQFSILKIFSLKEEGDQGIAKVAFARFNVIDKDGDVTLPGFFGKQVSSVVPVHDWRHVPLGKASISEEGEFAMAELKFNLKIQSARDWFEAIKFDKENPPAVQQYSYGFDIIEGGKALGNFEGKDVSFLKPLPSGSPGVKVWEISPVMVGAGEDTHTVGVKNKDNKEPNKDDGLKFCDEADAALAAVDGIVKRASSLAELRAKEGRKLSASALEKLKGLSASLHEAVDKVDGLMKEAPDEALSKEALTEFSRFVQNG